MPYSIKGEKLVREAYSLLFPEKEGEDFTEIKWVDPEELENYFTTSFHPSLKEYIINLK